MSVIETKNLTKDYGSGRGIFQVNLNIEKGEMLGFVGTNGSGKTTTIRSILGFIQPTLGEAYVNGLESRKNYSEILKHVGYVPGEIAFPDLPTGIAFLKSQAGFLGLKDFSKANELIEKLQLDPSAGLKRMSKGMKQKTAIVAALMNNPDIIILDEPTTGLDPLMRDVFLQVIKDEHKNGKTILMSSHIFEELETLSDKVAFISNGYIIDVAEMERIRNPEKREYKIEFFLQEDYENFKRENFDIVRDQPQFNQITVNINTSDILRLFKSLKKYNVRMIAEVKYNLEKYFRNKMLNKEKTNVQ